MDTIKRWNSCGELLRANMHLQSFMTNAIETHMVLQHRNVCFVSFCSIIYLFIYLLLFADIKLQYFAET